MGFGFYPPYVPVGERRKAAAKEVARLKKAGRTVSPVKIEGRTIATTFWGKAWCENLEAYSDFASRLPRGRTYVRNGSVMDLQLTPGRIKALVMGSMLYEVDVKIAKLEPAKWKALAGECAGKIDSLVELLAGRLSSGVMEVMTRKGQGLFPTPKQIDLDCSCPDSAGLCKHLAAVLYGVGARLDEKPELLFLLREVDQQDLVARVAAAPVATPAPAAGRRLEGDLGAVFGIELDAEPAPVAPAKKPARAKKTTAKGKRGRPRRP